MLLPVTAAKAALFRFIQSKETSQREKDLLKSVKVLSTIIDIEQDEQYSYVVQDNDLSRYIPGKVKLSLPQNHKAQYK